jgi:hypothetical protein
MSGWNWSLAARLAVAITIAVVVCIFEVAVAVGLAVLLDIHHPFATACLLVVLRSHRTAVLIGDHFAGAMIHVEGSSVRAFTPVDLLLVDVRCESVLIWLIVVGARLDTIPDA